MFHLITLEMTKKEDHQPTEVAKPTFVDKSIAFHRKFNLLSEIRDGDHVMIMIGKIIVRIMGLLFIIALSPFLFIGLMVAFLLAG